MRTVLVRMVECVRAKLVFLDSQASNGQMGTSESG